MSSGASPSLAARLVAACWAGDLPSAKALVADGASVHEKGNVPGWLGTDLPLTAAVYSKHEDVAVWLLSHGAYPNGDSVMFCGTYHSTAAILQLLIDAGGDINRKSNDEPTLFTAVRGFKSEGNVRVLLVQPSLDFTITYDGKRPEKYARDKGKPVVADMACRFAWFSRAEGVWRCRGWQIGRRATLVRPLPRSLDRACAVQRP